MIFFFSCICFMEFVHSVLAYWLFAGISVVHSNGIHIRYESDIDFVSFLSRLLFSDCLIDWLGSLIYSTSIAPAAPGLPPRLSCCTYSTKSSKVPGQAPSALHQPKFSSSRVLRINTSVCSHKSLLTGRLPLASRNSKYQSNHGVVGVFQSIPPLSLV